MPERVPGGDQVWDGLGRPVGAERLYSSPRSRVWLADLGERRVVVKQVVDGADADARYARELAALRLAGARRPPLVPELLAADPAVRVLVLEYLDAEPGLPDWVSFAAG
ncbi:hypothetical protein, partial [Actinophytocola sp.]|uniref:hypothetical protein n=1 Tax=Actinophytocola sp. TaxID=1872138 RepID=UPI002D7EF700